MSRQINNCESALIQQINTTIPQQENRNCEGRFIQLMLWLYNSLSSLNWTQDKLSTILLSLLVYLIFTILIYSKGLFLNHYIGVDEKFYPIIFNILLEFAD